MENWVMLSFFGDKGILVHFGDELDEERSRSYINCAHLIRQEKIGGITEVVVSFVTILVLYDPLKIDPEALVRRIRRIIAQEAGEIVLSVVCTLPKLQFEYKY